MPTAWAIAALIGSACDTHTIVPPGCAAAQPFDRRDDAQLHLDEALAAGKAERRGGALHGRPLRLLHQRRQRLAGPFAEVALDQAAVDLRFLPGSGGDRRGGLPGPLERRRVDGVDGRPVGDQLGGLLGLRPAGVGEVQAGGAAGQHAAGGAGLAVADEQHRVGRSFVASCLARLAIAIREQPTGDGRASDVQPGAGRPVWP